VFDKTGTLTSGNQQELEFVGDPLTKKETQLLWNLVNQSNHPVSRLIKSSLPNCNSLEVVNFKELEGKGIEATILAENCRLGSANWLEVSPQEKEGTVTVFEANGIVKGYFKIQHEYRNGLQQLLDKLSKKYSLSLLSGDNDNQAKKLSTYFPADSALLFNQLPAQKLATIKMLQAEHKKVMMIGDGLNDAGALRQADVGVAISENVNAFSPACDVILAADQFQQLHKILDFSKKCKRIVLASFIISFLYNGIGLSLAVQGLLSPVYAAILMPISSITVVGFVSVAVWAIHHLNFSRS
jgi:Cu+-exporting ATPase